MTIFITGASVGFGEAIARRFAQQKDNKIIALARRADKLQKLQNELGDTCEIIICDVNDTQNIRNSLKCLPKEFQTIDVLINNAGLALGLETADKADISDWETMITTNILAVVKLTHLLLPQMVEHKNGHIVNIGSIAGSYPYPCGNIYGATKAFIKQFSLNLRADLYDKNIRVTNIEPGLTDGSEFSIVRFKGDEKKAERLYKNASALLPEDIAEAVWWAVSLPKHININRIEMMPVTQAPAALNVSKTNCTKDYKKLD